MIKNFWILLLVLVSLFASAQQIAPIQKDSTVRVDTLKVIEVEGTTQEIAEKVEKELIEDLTPPPIWKFFSFSKIFWSLLLVLIGYLLIRFIVTVLERFAEKFTTQRITIKGLIPIVKIFGWIFVMILIVIGIFQPPAATVIAVMASLGIAIGFAAQDILKNVFGGVMILLDRPFKVGDKIEVGSFYGEVIEIGLRSIRIITPDDSLVSIPNGELMNKSVSNANNGEANCQVVAEIYLPITVNTNRVRQVAIESAQVSKYIYLNKPIAVLFFNEVKEKRSYLKMRLKAYVIDIRYEFAFKSDMTEIVMKQLLEEKLMDPEDLN
ncbi:mechanosensitive ion channel family protein [Aquimarina intermedia]|uniref:Mechanosensitive ion channel-like protein n=1 Tax=Aquimarina intermedia TaxID=350814 RepID=A0A5S5C4X6_9FLAO|nr:mechanosensitive ion channel domain-containing protein [Aquimarina intermedia]TYP74384.1 mechanosensitive ion channel-like protein [Aquimarina intermedia]